MFTTHRHRKVSQTELICCCCSSPRRGKEEDEDDEEGEEEELDSFLLFVFVLFVLSQCEFIILVT